MSFFKMNSAASEKEGARQLLNAMPNIPPAQEVLEMLEQQISIPYVGRRLQDMILKAIREERERNETLRRNLQEQTERVAALEQFIQNFSVGPRKAAEQAREAAEQKLREVQHNLTDLTQQRKLELAAKTREIEKLQAQNAELKRLVVKQQGQLSDLLGSSTPQ